MYIPDIQLANYVYIHCIWQIVLFQRYCYFRGVLAVIHFREILPLFQKATCSDLVFQGYCASLKQALAAMLFFKFWVNLPNQLQPCIRWRALFLLQKNLLQPCIFSNLLFLRSSSCRGDHSYQLSYQLWYLLFGRHVFIERLVCYLKTLSVHR